LNNAFAQIGGQARHSQGWGFATPCGGMAEPTTAGLCPATQLRSNCQGGRRPPASGDDWSL